MHVILPIIFLLKEQLCFFDNVGTDNVLFRNKKKLCLMKCCHLLEEIKNKVRFFFVFFSSIHATLSFSLTNTLFNFNNGEKSRKQQQRIFFIFFIPNKFWNVFLEHYIKHKPLISEAWTIHVTTNCVLPMDF